MSETRQVVTPREAREQFEEQVCRHMKGLFREFELYVRDKYGLRTVEEQVAALSQEERARLITARFNRSRGEDLAPPRS